MISKACKLIIYFFQYTIRSSYKLLSLSTKIFFMLSVSMQSKTIHAEKVPTKSYKIKAGFLLQFTSYVTWPLKESNNIFICLIGHDPFGPFIDEMITAHPTNRKGQAIEVRRLKTGDNLTNCDVAFITKESINERFFKSLSFDNSSLLVSDSIELLDKGGMISLNENKKHIQLTIHIQNSDRKKIVISPQLLRVSKIISPQKPQE